MVAYKKNIGDLYLLPVNVAHLPPSTIIESSPNATRVKTFTVIGSNSSTAHILESDYKCMKVTYYADLDDPLAILHALLVKKFKGENLFLECISTALYDEIPLNAVWDSTTKDATLLKGKEMKTYHIPWLQIGAPGLSDPGRSLDWSKTVRENNIQANEVVHCELYKPGNNLTAYGGAGKPDYSTLGLEVILGSLLRTRFLSAIKEATKACLNEYRQRFGSKHVERFFRQRATCGAHSHREAAIASRLTPWDRL